MGINHIQIHVSSLAESTKFYLAALGPLGYKQLYSEEGVIAGLGVDGGKPHIYLRQVKADASPSHRVHVAFEAKTRAAVDQFHEAALCVYCRNFEELALNHTIILQESRSKGQWWAWREGILRGLLRCLCF